MNDYKELISDLRCHTDYNTVLIDCEKAADAIEQLVNENESYREALSDLHNEIANLSESVAILEKERDAAVTDISLLIVTKYACEICKHRSGDNPTYCLGCYEPNRNGNFEWRGVEGAE